MFVPTPESLALLCGVVCERVCCFMWHCIPPRMWWCVLFVSGVKSRAIRWLSPSHTPTTVGMRGWVYASGGVAG